MICYCTTQWRCTNTISCVIFCILCIYTIHTAGSVDTSSSALPPISIVFVPSRKQSQLTAIDLMTYAAADNMPNRFLGVAPDDDDLNKIVNTTGTYMQLLL